jgi:hypothetical protein
MASKPMKRCLLVHFSKAEEKEDGKVMVWGQRSLGLPMEVISPGTWAKGSHSNLGIPFLECFLRAESHRCQSVRGAEIAKAELDSFRH